MFCPYCGEKIIDTAKFCPQCGKRLREAPAPQEAPAPEAAEPSAPEKEHVFPKSEASPGRSSKGPLPLSPHTTGRELP